MRVGTILEVAFRILRTHWAVLLAISLLLAGPAALLTAATSAVISDAGAGEVLEQLAEGALDDAPTVTEAQIERLIGPVVSGFIATIIAGLLTSIAALGFSIIVGADYFRVRPQLPGSLRVSLRRTPSAIVFIFVTSLLMIGLVLLGIVIAATAMSLSGGSIQGGGIGVFVGLIVIVFMVVAVVYLTVRWAVAFPAMAIEALGWRVALARTWRLTADNVWRTFFMVLFGGLITAALGGLVSQLAAILLVDVVGDLLGLDGVVGLTISSALGSVLLAPVAPVLLAVLYFDLRIRHEGVVEAPAPADEG
jgi:hypothetical protein